jgi:hypothetical protein
MTGSALSLKDASSKVAVSPLVEVDDDRDHELAMEVDKDDTDKDTPTQPDVLSEADSFQPDILPETHFIETGNTFQGESLLFLRAEYIRIFNWIKHIYREYLESEGQLPPVAVITGHPGIGACCRCLH